MLQLIWSGEMKLTMFEKAVLIAALFIVVGIAFQLPGMGSMEKPGIIRETSIAPVLDELTGQPAERELININTAPVEELQTLKGIGESLADSIVQYRTEHGPFESINDLLNVNGIGEKKLEAIKERITVGR